MSTRKPAARKFWESEFVQAKSKSFIEKFPHAGKTLDDQHYDVAAILVVGKVQRDLGNWFITDPSNRTFKVGDHQCDCGQSGLCVHRLTANFAYWMNLPIGEEACHGAAQ